MALNDRDYMRDDNPGGINAQDHADAAYRRRGKKTSVSILSRLKFWLWRLFHGRPD